MVLEIIKPDLINRLDGIEGWFTCKNSNMNIKDQQVAGLNLGFNTDEKDEIVEEHRSTLLEELKIPRDQIAFADQVHGTEVQNIIEGGIVECTDALVTKIPGLALAIQVADCAAVLLADEKHKVIGAVHAGWRGAVGEIVPMTINRMKSLGAQPKDIQAFVSPCISLEHFEVGAEVAEQFPEEFVDRDSYTKPHVNLKAYVSYQLQLMGIPESHIEVHHDCTVADKQYYSYRREKEKSGRMLGIIRLSP